MEATIAKELLNYGSYGWVGWISFAMIAITAVLSILSKNIINIIRNLKALQRTIKATNTDYTKHIKNEVDVTEILRAIRHDLYADRVVVLQYHNGVHSIANNHLLKISATHEVVGKDVRSMLKEIQSWPSNYLGEWNNEVFEDKYVSVSSCIDLEDTPGLRGIREFLNAYTVSKMLLFPITDSYGKVFGVGMVHLSGRSRFPDDDLIRWASQRFYAVGALLAGTQE